MRRQPVWIGKVCRRHPMGEHAQTGEVVVPNPVAIGIVDLAVHFHAKHGSRAEEVEISTVLLDTENGT